MDYAAYQPLPLDNVTAETISSDDYRRFIFASAIEPGVRLLLHRHRRRSDWPYVDTKFNPNTGADLGEAAYGVVYTWFLGRGTEALSEHLAWLDELDGLSSQERTEARQLLRRLVANMGQAMLKVLELNDGRCPFRVDLQMRGVDERGKPVKMDPSITSGADIFVGKGLIAEGSAPVVRRGLSVLQRSAECIRRNRYRVDQFAAQPKDIGHGPKMLIQGAAALACRRTKDLAIQAAALNLSAEFMTSILDLHYDLASGLFSEYIDALTGQRKSYLDPGHANEFVGLGLAAVEAMRTHPDAAGSGKSWLIERACRELPRLLIVSTQRGFNPKYPGLFKAVDTATGGVIIDDMPWWNLPETMRAAVRAYEVTSDGPARQQCLRIFRDCHNAYFSQYPNRANMLFPYQTISGTTGQVVDRVPAVPEGDPLYHANLSFLDMLEVAQRL